MTGSDVTVVGYGAQLQTLRKACAMAQNEGISCEIIDLRTIIPWDVSTVAEVSGLHALYTVIHACIVPLKYLNSKLMKFIVEIIL